MNFPKQPGGCLPPEVTHLFELKSGLLSGSVCGFAGTGDLTTTPYITLAGIAFVLTDIDEPLARHL